VSHLPAADQREHAEDRSPSKPLAQRKRSTAVTRREWIFLGAAILGLLVGLASLGWTLVNYDGRQDIDLDSFVESSELGLPGGRIATEDLCTEILPCVQAVDSDAMTLRRFDSAQEASAGAAALGGDVRVAGWILVEFTAGELSEAEKSDFMATLYCINVGPDPC
jgi:hypothetical protein